MDRVGDGARPWRRDIGRPIDPENDVFYSWRMEQPPQFGPDEKPGPGEFSRLAGELLREMAQHDLRLAERLRLDGHDPESSENTA